MLIFFSFDYNLFILQNFKLNKKTAKAGDSETFDFMFKYIYWNFNIVGTYSSYCNII